MSVVEHDLPEAPASGTPLRPSGLPAPGGNDLNVWRSLRRHALFAALIAFVVLGAGLPIAWIIGAARYQSTAVVFVSPHFVANLQDGKEVAQKSDAQYREYIQQNARTINRFDIVSEALKNLGPRNTVWVKPDESFDRAVERLQKALKVEPVPDTYQITVTLENSRLQGLADLVNEIVAVYLEKAKSEEFYASDERVKSLTQDRTGVQQEIQDKQARRLAIAQELGVSSFTENFVNPYDRLLLMAKEALATARRQNIEAEAQLAALDEKQRNGGMEALRAMSEVEVGKDPSLAALEANQSIRRTQLLTSMSGLSPDHPGRRAAERELAQLDAERKAVYNRLVESWSKALLDQRTAEAYKTARIEERLNTEVQKQESQATWFTKNYQEGMELGIGVDQARKRIDGIQQRIDFLSLEKNAPGFVRVFSPARAPNQPSKGGRRKLIALVLAASLILGLLAPVGVDMLDPRVRTPRNVETLLGFAPVAWLLERSAGTADFVREQVTRLATRIVQDQQSNGSRIFAFTSVKARGGTTSIVMDTAAAIGRLGLSTLAVEANAYRSDPRYSSANSRGLTFVLRSDQDIASAVVPGHGEMPDHVPVGDLTDQKHLPEIQQLLERLRTSSNSYAIVLIDLPPILVSVDAEFIARGADVTVLVIGAEEVNRSELRRAAACLERIGVSAVSAVLNKVSLDAGDGFARQMRDEFRTGTAPASTGWFGRHFWR